MTNQPPDESPEEPSEVPSDELPQDDFEPTRVLPLTELPLQPRIDADMAAIVGDYHRVALAIAHFWGHPECVPYLQNLIMDGYTEDGQRLGFKKEAMRALIDLLTIHQQEY